ncbi:MB12A protein, partial [Atlantisia rogersi]|nr:MB12A protein [Atlantisia rogersi]
ITVTAEGAAANLGRGFGHKGGGYLCVRSAGDQTAPAAVVTDVQVLSDRSPQPAGYIRAPEFPEPRAGLSRKKRLYVKLLPPDAADTAVLDVKLSAKSKALPQYLRVGELGNFAIWCKKGPIPKSSPPPVPKPRTLSAGLKQLSLQPPAPDPAYTLIIIFHHARPHRDFRSRRLTARPCRLSLLSPAMDGVPFALHPRFERSLGSGSTPVLTGLNVKSLADIEKEYDYTFVVERTAAARLPPGIC